MKNQAFSEIKGLKLRHFGLLAMLLIATLFLLASCKTANKIQGTWQVQDGSGANSELVFTKDTVRINRVTYKFKQTTVGNANGEEYFGIVQDGQTYSIVFPDKEDKNVAIMLLPNDSDHLLQGKLVYAMNKKEKPDYAKYAAKYLK